MTVEEVKIENNESKTTGSDVKIVVPEKNCSPLKSPIEQECERIWLDIVKEIAEEIAANPHGPIDTKIAIVYIRLGDAKVNKNHQQALLNLIDQAPHNEQDRRMFKSVVELGVQENFQPHALDRVREQVLQPHALDRVKEHVSQPIDPLQAARRMIAHPGIASAPLHHNQGGHEVSSL